MKDIHTYGKKMARNGRTRDIYKGTFICIQTLLQNSCKKTRHKIFMNKVSKYVFHMCTAYVKHTYLDLLKSKIYFAYKSKPGIQLFNFLSGFLTNTIFDVFQVCYITVSFLMSFVISRNL